jgi:glyoxylase-like metal-dependent hydrolase (beta-lactamase superfamily II)
MMHHADAAAIRNGPEEYSALMHSIACWIGDNGTPEEEVRPMLSNSLEVAKSFEPIKVEIALFGGEALKVGSRWNLEVIHTPGHTRGTICLFEKRSGLLFSGDHVLPTITPNVSLGPLYIGDPLGDYLESLGRVEELEARNILPSHEFVFSDLRGRAREIREHHANRLKNTLEILKNSATQSAYEIATQLDWYAPWEKLNPGEKRAAVLETLAHVQYLKVRGSVSESRSIRRTKELTVFEALSS